MKVIIDRFEGDYAVVELNNKEMADLPKTLLPEGSKEGDILNITIDQNETTKRIERIKKLTQDLWE